MATESSLNVRYWPQADLKNRVKKERKMCVVVPHLLARETLRSPVASLWPVVLHTIKRIIVSSLKADIEEVPIQRIVWQNDTLKH